jgi:hypothetical protein
MEQRCHLAAVWLTWLGLPLLAVVVGFRVGPVAGLGVLAAGFLAQVLYLCFFPHISRWLGYGSVADVPAPAMPRGTPLPPSRCTPPASAPSARSCGSGSMTSSAITGSRSTRWMSPSGPR